ncbi:MAG: hypothetical protein OEW83_17770 [Acidimicrobiia bacterium]|nr:hypothetical protein [Acidimicrobiia bacterium]
MVVLRGTKPPIGTPSESDLVHVLDVARAAAWHAGAVPHEVDEVAQRTTIKLWHHWEDSNVEAVRQGSTFQWDAYIRQTARNVHRDLIRSHHRRLNRNTIASGVSTVLTSRPGTIRPIPWTPNGIVSYLARQRILESIEILPRNQRVVATLCIIGELTPREAGELLDLQAQSVRKHLRAAKHTLASLLSEPEINDGPYPRSFQRDT